MLARTYTSTLVGIDGLVISVEVNLAKGIPYTHVIGRTDNVVKESIERIRAAITNDSMAFPLCRITINLAPADIKKRGSHYDLPIAVAIIAASDPKRIKINLEEYAFFGELSLDGKVNPVRGMLPLAMSAQEQGIKNIVVPYDNRYEVSLLKECRLVCVKCLNDVIKIIEGKESSYQLHINEEKCEEGADLFNVKDLEEEKSNNKLKDFNQVYGQENIKRAMVIAAAGGHNMLIMGAPGTGKSMLAERFIDILPPMSYKEQVEVTKIHSIGGIMKNNMPLLNKRPFRAPHNSITAAGMFGGGAEPKPGELSYAHNGVLFLDELQQFETNILQLMRVPLETKEIIINRNRNTYVFPADTLLLAAVNPCKCGYRDDPKHMCTCTQSQLNHYFDKLSGPFIDRIDMQVRMNPIEYEVIENPTDGMSTKDMKILVTLARKLQENRYINEDFKLNGNLDEEGIKKYIILDKESKEFLKLVFNRKGLSVRSYNKILKMARTIADVDNQEQITIKHIAEAVQYRNLEELCREKYKLKGELCIEEKENM